MRKCGEFYEEFLIHLDYDGGKHEIECKCTKCKSVLKGIDYEVVESDSWIEKQIKLQKYPCPLCGKNNLYEGEEAMILWD